jgi:hypothetical protein
MRLLLSPDDPGSAPGSPPPGQSPPPPNPAASAAPPAAEAVLNATRTEQDAGLAAQLETERAARKKAETDAAYLRDENLRLKSVPAPPPPPPEKKKSSGFRFTLLEDEED